MPPMGPPNRNRNQKKQKPKNTKATAKRLFSYLEQEKHKIAAAFVWCFGKFCVNIVRLVSFKTDY